MSKEANPIIKNHRPPYSLILLAMKAVNDFKEPHTLEEYCSAIVEAVIPAIRLLDREVSHIVHSIDLPYQTPELLDIAVGAFNNVHDMDTRTEDYCRSILGAVGPVIWAAALEEAADDHDEVARLRTAIQRFIDGDYPRPVGTTFRDDGKPSKHDQCPHKIWMYEACDACASDWFSRSLIPKPPEGT